MEIKALKPSLFSSVYYICRRSEGFVVVDFAVRIADVYLCIIFFIPFILPVVRSNNLICYPQSELLIVGSKTLQH